MKKIRINIFKFTFQIWVGAHEQCDQMGKVIVQCYSLATSVTRLGDFLKIFLQK